MSSGRLENSRLRAGWQEIRAGMRFGFAISSPQSNDGLSTITRTGASKSDHETTEGA